MDDQFVIQESSFRKGYYNGYERAVLDLQSMLSDGIHPEQAIVHCLEFVVDELKQWRYANQELRILPPQINPQK